VVDCRFGSQYWLKLGTTCIFVVPPAYSAEIAHDFTAFVQYSFALGMTAIATVKKDQKHWHRQRQMAYLLQLHLWAKPRHSYHRQAATDPYTSRLLTGRVGGGNGAGRVVVLKR